MVISVVLLIGAAITKQGNIICGSVVCAIAAAISSVVYLCTRRKKKILIDGYWYTKDGENYKAANPSRRWK